MIDRVGEILARRIFYGFDGVAAFVFTVEIKVALQLGSSERIIDVAGFSLVGDVAVCQNVLVKLQPEILEHVWRVILVGDRFRADDHVGFIIELHADVVVGLLLPVVGAGGSRARPEFVWSWQHLPELLKLALPLLAKGTDSARKRK